MAAGRGGGGAVLTLLAATAVYQPAAMFFWVFAAIALLKPEADSRDALRRFLWLCVIGLASMAAGFALYESSLALNPHLSARTGLVQDIPTKIVYFLAVSFPSALNFALPSPSWYLFQEAAADSSARLYQTLSDVLNALDIAIFPSHRDVDAKASHAWFAAAAPGRLSLIHKITDIFIAYGFFAVVFGGLWLYFRGEGRARLWKYVFALSLLLLSAAPILSVAENSASYRSMPALVSIVVLYTYFAFLGYARHLPRLLSPARANAIVGGAAILCVLSAAHHVRAYFVAPQIRELAFMRSQLGEGDLSRARSVRVIRPEWWRGSFAPFKWREFGYPSSFHVWSPPAMVSLLLREMAPKQARLPVTVIDAEEAGKPPPPGALVVDMRIVDMRKSSAREEGRAPGDSEGSRP